MRDLLLITPPQDARNWCLDFDIIDGYPKYVPDARNTQDQRAAVAAYMFRGSIPGKPDLGIDWSGLYSTEERETLIEIDNEVKQAIQEYAAIPEGPNAMYVPLYDATEDGIQLAIYQG